MSAAPSAVRRLFLLVFLSLAVGLVAVGYEHRDAATAEAALDWKQCGSFECATLSVPLDYDNAAGRQIQLSLVRQKAKDPSQRIGSLLVNPGGPGASGVDFARGWARSLPKDMQDRFDIVGFDPRGVGGSTPLVCHDNLQKLAGLDPSPKSKAAWTNIDEVTKAFADACAAKGKDVLPYFGTENVARDMDRIRDALGDDKITYFGYSYGTVIGAVYADMFPDKVRAIVLDGAVDYTLASDDFSLQQALGFEGALQHFADDCTRRQCVLTKTGKTPISAIEELIAKTEAAPIPAPNADRAAGPGETLLAVVGSLYTSETWEDLATAVQAGLDGDGSRLVKITDRYLGRSRDGSYDNSTEMNVAVNCLDYTSNRDPAHYEDLAAKYSPKAPHFGSSLAQGSLICAYWAVDPKPLHPPKAHGSAPILVVGTTGDPATPYSWAVSVSKQLENAVLLTHNGEGHTAYRNGDNCIDVAVDDYLADLKLPDKGTACGPQSMAQPIQVTSTPQPGAEGPNITGTASPKGSSGHTSDAGIIAGIAAIILAGAVTTIILVRLRNRHTHSSP